MEFVQKIGWYYTTESRHGFTAAVFGGLLLFVGLLLWKFARPLSVLKGLILPFFIFGLIMGFGGFGDGYVTRKALPQKVRLYQKDKQAFFKEEVPKVQRTHRSWFGIRTFWSVVTVTGLALLFLLKKNYWIGVGLGTLLLGIAGHVEEAMSMKYNEEYYHEVMKASGQNITSAREHQKVDNKSKRAVSDIKGEPEGKERSSDNIKEHLVEVYGAPADSVVKNQLRMNTDSLNNLTMTRSVMDTALSELSVTSFNAASAVNNDEQQPPFKRKKLIDYYRSDLIQKNGVSPKHCWLGKKYID